MANKNTTNERRRKSKNAGGKEEKVVMMTCCPEGEEGATSLELKDGVLLKLGEGLGDRGNVVMTRLDDADLKQIDALVEVEAFKSRSEAAAYFIKQGMKARSDLFKGIMSTVDKIRELKQQAKKELARSRSRPEARA